MGYCDIEVYGSFPGTRNKNVAESAEHRSLFSAESTELLLQEGWRGPGGNRARDLSNMGPWSGRMMSFRVAFGARCAFLGSFLVCGAPFLGSVLVRGAWCAHSGVDFGVRCAVFGLAPILGPILVHSAPYWVRFWCAVCGAPILGPILVRGVWCADFGADFGARCAVFWTRFWCAVCGAPIFGPILVHGAAFWVRCWCAVCGAPIFGSILVHGAPCVTSNQATPQTPC